MQEHPPIWSTTEANVAFPAEHSRSQNRKPRDNEGTTGTLQPQEKEKTREEGSGKEPSLREQKERYREANVNHSNLLCLS